METTRPTPPLRIGHRGAPREFPENTLPSFARALDLGADGIELDVHRTVDGVVVVHHDPIPAASVDDPTLATRPISQLSFAQLSEFAVAPGIGIPTLADVLDLVGRSAIVYVEIKGTAIERDVIAVIRDSRSLCAVHSFDHGAVTRMRELAPDIRRGILFSRPLADITASLTTTGALDAWPKWHLIDDQLVDAVRRAGADVIAWTVNEPAVAERLTAIGVHGLCTDDIRIVPDVPRPVGRRPN